MIRWRVREIAEQRGIASAAQLAERAQVAQNTATSLWYGRPLRVDLPTLERVCRALACTIGDVLVLEEDIRMPGLVLALPPAY
jgi:DNA-binding Xre family transcriptional regulator